MAFIDISANALTYAEASEIYSEIIRNLDDRDRDHQEFYEDLVKKCIRYAGIRAEWRQKTVQEKLDTDSSRTSAHDAVIRGLTIIGRLQGEKAEGWMNKLCMDDRKRIGDLACYVALWSGLEAR